MQGELSQTLQLLSEKAKAATEEIGKLKQLQDKLNVRLPEEGTTRLQNNCNDFKTAVCIQVDALMELLQQRKEKLLQFVDDEKDYKVSSPSLRGTFLQKRMLKDQIGRCTAKLSKTTSLIQFCIEILKEPDPAVYLQVPEPSVPPKCAD